MKRIEEKHVAEAKTKLDELWASADDLLTPSQRKRFAELRSETDVERRSRMTVAFAEEILAEAESGADEFEAACLRRGIHLMDFERLLSGDASRQAKADADEFIRRTAEQAKREWMIESSPSPASAAWRRMSV